MYDEEDDYDDAVIEGHILILIARTGCGIKHGEILKHISRRGLSVGEAVS